MTWVFYPDEGRYCDDETEECLSVADLQEFLERESHADEMFVAILAALLAQGRLSEAGWSEALWDEIVQAYTRQYALGRGGINAMTREDWRKLGKILDGQRKYYERFVREVTEGKLSEAQIGMRSSMYLSGARQAYELAFAEMQRAAGMQEERWVLSPGAKHCHDCLAFEAMGWQPLGTFPTPCDGSTQCLGNCRCHKEYRVAPPEGGG